jgi:hypothetical protein
MMDKIKTPEAQVAEFQDRLDEFMSGQPVMDGTASETYNKQTCPPISHLPYEMLSAIFRNGPMSPSSRMGFALSVSQVSCCWRGTAMQTPFLWSGFYLLPWRTGRGYRKFLEVLVQRSHSHPLDIAIKLDGLDAPPVINMRNLMMALTRESQSSYLTISTHCLQAQLDIVIPEVSRWRSFTYRCDYPDEVVEITRRLAHLSATILRSFELEVIYRTAECQPHNIFQDGTPLLTHIHIDGVKPTVCLPPLSFITSLHLGEGSKQMNGAKFLSMLRFAPNLVSLHFDGTVVDPKDLYKLALLGQGIDIATLRSFSFSADASPKYCIDGILNTIRCPSLESLTISNLDFLGGVQPMELSFTMGLPTPPFPTLQSFKLSGIECAEFAEHFDFTHLPALDIISLTDSESPMALLCSLLPFRGSNSVWPVLRIIALSHIGPKEFDGLRTIIFHRRACGKPIETVLLDPASLENFPEQVEWLKQHATVQRGDCVH